MYTKTLVRVVQDLKTIKKDITVNYKINYKEINK